MSFDGAGCLKWFSGDGSSVWCQWDRGGAHGETRRRRGVGCVMVYRIWGTQAEEEQRMEEKKRGKKRQEREEVRYSGEEKKKTLRKKAKQHMIARNSCKSEEEKKKRQAIKPNLQICV